MKDYEIKDLRERLQESDAKKDELQKEMQRLVKSYEDQEYSLRTKYEIMEVQMKNHIDNIELANKKDMESFNKESGTEKKELWNLINEKEYAIQKLEQENKTLTDSKNDEINKLRHEIEVLI